MLNERGNDLVRLMSEFILRTPKQRWSACPTYGCNEISGLHRSFTCDNGTISAVATVRYLGVDVLTLAEGTEI